VIDVRPDTEVLRHWNEDSVDVATRERKSGMLLLLLLADQENKSTKSWLFLIP
jgi:hypothetical protein